MRVLIWSAVDTGGQGYRIAKGFERHTDWEVTAIGDGGPLGYPEQSPMSPVRRKIEGHRAWDAADVVHMRNSLMGWEQMDHGQYKPLVLHHHGTAFRTNHGSIANAARAIGAVQIASTLDLTILEPDVEWVPSPYDLDELAALRREHYEPDDVIRIAHYPTSQKIKSTDVFMAATARLAERYPIHVLSNYSRNKVRFLPWWHAMSYKAQADIYYDQCILGYGNNAVEAWGMGIPVLAGVRDEKVRTLMLQRFGGSLPFKETSEETMEHDLEEMIKSAQMREEYSERGLAHVRRFHDEAKVVEQLKDVYLRAKPTHGTAPRVQPSWLSQRRRAKVVA